MKDLSFKFVASLVLALVSLDLMAATYYVAEDGNDGAVGDAEHPLATIATALGKSDVTEVVVNAGTYSQTAVISLTTGVTIRGATGNPTDVTLDFQGNSQGFSINHASAVVQDLRIYRGAAPLLTNGGGVAFGANGGKLQNCIVDTCRIKSNTASYGGGGIYINGGAVVTGCVIKNCVFGSNTGTKAIGVLIADGTLARSLVVGCRRDGLVGGKDAVGAVVLTKGTVDRCTIVGNEVMTAPLSVANSASCTVRDTIVWGNVAFREAGSGRPNVSIGGSKAVVSGLCTTGSFGTNPLDANPSFVDAAKGDYRLSPASPCRGAGTDGCDLGYADYDASAAKAGIRVSDYKGNDELAVDVSLMTREGLGVKSVTWEGLSETGASIRPTFGIGNHTLTAHVVYSDDSTGDVTLRDAVKVVNTGKVSVSTSEELDAALATAGDGVTICLAEGDYVLSQKFYFLLDGIRIIGTGLREKTVLTKKDNEQRFFFLGNEKASVCNVTMKNAATTCTGGAVWIADGGGMVSNCVITGCTVDSSQNGGGVYMEAEKALLTHSLVSGNKAGNTNGKGAGVYLSSGTVQNCLIVKNTAGNNGDGNLGGGIYMGAATDKAKVVNCTVAGNTAKTGGGIYRVAKSGYVYNTIVFGNTVKSGDKDICSADNGTTRPTATSISHCCTSADIGANCQVVTEAPYDPTTYELTAAKSAKCINLGCNDYVTAATDYVGASRIFNGTVDIGCYEYSKVEIVASFTSDKAEAAGKTTFTFTANLSGATGDDWTCAWYLDGSSEVAGTGKVWSPELDVGRHAVRVVVTYNSTEYPCQEAQTYVVYPTEAYVGVGTLSVWPYDTPENAATNVNVAVKEVLRDGVTLHVASGSYCLTNTVSVGKGQRLVGAGADETVFYVKGERRVMLINGTGAWVEGVCLSNGWSNGGGLYVTGDGGTFTRGRIVKCKGSTNLAGGGALMNASKGVISRTVFEANQTEATAGGSDAAGVNYNGGGISMSAGLVENCLFVGNKAKRGGAIDLGGGRVRNCTIVGNEAGLTVSGGGGGIYASSASAEISNCILWDNLASGSPAGSSAQDFAGYSTGAQNCCLPVAFGQNPVTAAPQFKDAAAGDYRIGAGSPCAYKGVYQGWMADAVDFFGNPRATPGKRVSIGFCQAPSPGLLLLVR